MRFSAIFCSLFAALAIATPTGDIERRQNGCVSGTNDVNGNRITITCGKDWSGPSYKQSQAQSAQDCANKCAADQRCSFASFWRVTCYFKERTSGQNNAAEVAAIDIKPAPVVACVAGSRDVDGKRITTQCGKDWVGVSYAQAFADNTADCANKCAADARCQFASFWRVHCYFKDATTGLGDAAEVSAIDIKATPTETTQVAP